MNETAATRLAEIVVDFAAAGIERFGGVDEFMAALAAYNAEKAA